MMDLEKLSKEVTERFNNQMLDDFSGFTPNQMHQIVYDPFGLDCPIRMYIDFEFEYLNLSPLFNIAYSLLNKINESGKIKLTAKGNLPGKLIKTIYDERLFPDEMIEKGITKLRMESNWIILHTIHIVLRLSGLIRKYHGNLFLTKKGLKYLTEGNESRFFLNLLETYSIKFNWGYNDIYEIEDIGQIGFLYLLFLLKKFGSKAREISFYSNLYFKAFPTFLNNYQNHNYFLEKSPNNALNVRFFERFAYWFGFIEYEGFENLLYLDENTKIKKTQLLDSLLV